MVSNDVSISNPAPGEGEVKASYSPIKQIIGVMSTKGGVGKSFTTALLACQLAREGYQVGILDANFTGASIPLLFGLQGHATVGQYSFLPLESCSGVKIISPNLLFEEQDQVILWKDSMGAKVIEELWKEVEWGTLDYLLVDLPPATSEVAVNILQTLPFKGVILVTTPQSLAVRITRDAAVAAQKVGAPILGIVENMSYYINPATREKGYLFGHSQTEGAATIADAPVLAHIPLDPEVAQLCDLGKIEEVKLDPSLELLESLLESIAVLDEKMALASAASANGGQDTRHAPIVQPARQGFSDTVIDLIRKRENMGVLEHPDAQGLFMGRCGDRMQIDLRITAGRIKEARFVADGCGATLACGSMITRMASSHTLEQAEKITPEELITALDGLPDDHLHCAELAVMTLREAVIDAREGHGTKR